MRFLQPILPFVLYIVACSLGRGSRLLVSWWTRLLFITINLVLALYLSLVHQRGAVDVALWLGQQGEEQSINQSYYTELIHCPVPWRIRVRI